jgi:cysteine desulfurase
MNNKKIYLDYAATSPTKKVVLEAMKSYFSEYFGNPSSIHSFGQETRRAINQARETAAKFFNCQVNEVIFTSGGTESDNLAIRGIVEQCKNDMIVGKPHIITSEFEHHAILHTCEELEKSYDAEITYIKPNKDGLINVEDIKKAIKPNTVLVSIMYVNNEIGTVQPIAEIGKMISMINELRVKNYAKNHNSSSKIHDSRIYFHTDAVQAVEYFDCNVKKLNVDLLSLSAHKFGGPKGSGILYVSKNVILKPQVTGGAQEYGMRAGTENVPAIIGMAKAIQLLNQKSKIHLGLTESRRVKNQKLTKLRDYFINQVIKKIPNATLNGSGKYRSPNNVNFSFKNVEGESILLNLDLLGISASSGSACTSGSLLPSHVLLAIGVKQEQAHGAIRFTLGDLTTKQDINYVLKELPKIIEKLRKMSPYK